jgi:hypothetical protein
MYYTVKELPTHIRNALKTAGYNRVDIEVKTVTEVSPAHSAGTGRRAYVVLIDTVTGVTTTRTGSWGGPNMFTPNNVVDNDNRPYPIPRHGAVIKGTTGYGTDYATLYIHPDAARSLESGTTVELTGEQIIGLRVHKELKGGHYRTDALRRHKIGAPVIDGLVSLGLLKRNSAGSTQITTDGRNAIEAAGNPRTPYL